MAFVRNERKGPVVIGNALPGGKCLKLGRPGTRRHIIEVEKSNSALDRAQRSGLIKIFETRAKAEAKPKPKSKPKADKKPEAGPEVGSEADNKQEADK